MFQSENPIEGIAWCLPWSKEREMLASAKLGVPSNSAVLEPMQYDANVNERGKRGIRTKQHGSPFIMLLK
jgi:hypothetical protein